jgi:hypothetical protein
MPSASSDDDGQGSSDDEMEDVEQEGNGDETTTSGAAGDGNETTTSGIQAKHRWKDRRPNTVGTVRSIVKEVDPASGLPTETKNVAKWYGLQCAAILRDTVSLNETNIRHKTKQHLCILLISMQHTRYQFPDD